MDLSWNKQTYETNCQKNLLNKGLWRNGNASAYGAEDSRFDPWQPRIHFWNGCIINMIGHCWEWTKLNGSVSRYARVVKGSDLKSDAVSARRFESCWRRFIFQTAYNFINNYNVQKYLPRSKAQTGFEPATFCLQDRCSTTKLLSRMKV